ncbi:MAG: IclR family transcriptional regulator [Clostridia bacterium]|nr:IclR family transcriptional regulator [Clostridia bacterium]
MRRRIEISECHRAKGYFTEWKSVVSMSARDDRESGTAECRSSVAVSPDETGAKTVRSVERAFDILDCFSFQQRELTLTEIARAVDLPVPTTHRLIRVLQRRGWLRQDERTGIYSLGLHVLERGAIVLSGFTLREKAQPVLDALAASTSGTVLLGVIEDGELVYVDRRDSRAPLRVVSEVGQVRPINYGILGKLLLAYTPEQHVREVLKASPLVKRARRAFVSEEEFIAELARVRQSGYAIAVDETTDGVAGVAAPIMGVDGRVVAGLAVLMPTATWNDDVCARDLNAVRASAAELSKLMGYRAVLVRGQLHE